MWLIAQNDIQAAMLAPTEVLAIQHYATLLKLFLIDSIDIALLTSSNTRINGNPVTKNTLLAQIKSGKVKVVIGTHALLEKNVAFHNLGQVIIDEQHRFGVEQRSVLKNLHNAH